MKRSDRANSGPTRARRTAFGVAFAMLACTAGLGMALATTPEAPEATGAETAGGSADVVTFHQGLGFDFAELAGEVTEDMTPAEASKATVGTREFCLQCHDWDAIVDATCLPGDVTVYNKQGLYNVHDNHNGLVDCKDCHSVDGGASTLVCVQCHYMELPEGWEGFY